MYNLDCDFCQDVEFGEDPESKPPKQSSMNANPIAKGAPKGYDACMPRQWILPQGGKR